MAAAMAAKINAMLMAKGKLLTPPPLPAKVHDFEKVLSITVCFCSTQRMIVSFITFHLSDASKYSCTTLYRRDGGHRG